MHFSSCCSYLIWFVDLDFDAFEPFVPEVGVGHASLFISLVRFALSASQALSVLLSNTNQSGCFSPFHNVLSTCKPMALDIFTRI